MKSRSRLLLLACLAPLASLLLAACGGGGESDEDKVTEVVTEAAVEETPEHCTELLTQNFNEQTQKASGKEAVEKCEEEAEEGNGADSVDVTNVKVDGESGEADVAFVGGDFDGQTLKVAVVEEDGQWKLDEVVSFVKFDRAKYFENLTGSLQENLENPAEAEEAECFIEGFGELSDQGLQELILDPEGGPLGEVAEACQ